jgi:hypothetical protein
MDQAGTRPGRRIAVGQVGVTGEVVGIDMTPKMLTKSGRTGAHVSFRDGLDYMSSGG